MRRFIQKYLVISAAIADNSLDGKQRLTKTLMKTTEFIPSNALQPPNKMKTTSDKKRLIKQIANHMLTEAVLKEEIKRLKSIIAEYELRKESLP